MSDILSIPLDIFIEKPVNEVKVEYNMYALQEDGWYDPDGKYLKERAIVSQWGPYPNEIDAREHFKGYLSQKRSFLIYFTVIGSLKGVLPSVPSGFLSAVDAPGSL